jgi:hypothetical protein
MVTLELGLEGVRQEKVEGLGDHIFTMCLENRVGPCGWSLGGNRGRK